MFKRLFAFLLSLGMLLSLCGYVCADPVTVGATLPLIVDEAGLLTREEQAALEAKAAEISERQACQVTVYTANDLQGLSEEEFADEKLDQYGFGEDKSAILLFVYYLGPGREENYMYQAGQGFGIDAVTDYGREYLFDQIQDEMSEGDFAAAFDEYLDTADELLTLARNGEPMDEIIYEPGIEDPYIQRERPKPNFVIIGVVSLLLGFLFSLIPLASMKAKIRNVSKKTNATSYVRDGSMQLDVNRDIFLYASTTHRTIDTGSGSGARGSGGGVHHAGGSTTHVTSSGSVHSGGGRHF